MNTQTLTAEPLQLHRVKSYYSTTTYSVSECVCVRIRAYGDKEGLMRSSHTYTVTSLYFSGGGWGGLLAGPSASPHVYQHNHKNTIVPRRNYANGEHARTQLLEWPSCHINPSGVFTGP